MPFSDDIILRLGLDPRQFNRELKGARAKLSSWGRQIGGMFAVGGGGALGRKVMQFADALDTMSETIGTNAEFLQGWQEANLTSGVAVEKSTMGLQRFSRRLAEARKGTGVMVDEFKSLGIELVDERGNIRTLEAVLMDYTNAIANTSNEQEQLRLAFKAFDSEGAQMVATLKQGSTELQRLMKSASMLTNEDVSELAAANVEIEKMSRRVTIFGGKTFRFLDNVVGAIPRLAGSVLGGSDHIGGVAAMFNVKPEGEARVKELTRQLEQQKRLRQEIADTEKAATGSAAPIFATIALEAERLALLRQQVLAIREAEMARKSALRDRSSISLAELAGMQPGDPRIQSQSAVDKILKARLIQNAENLASMHRLNNNSLMAEAITNEAIKMRGELNILPESEQFPLQRMDQNIATLTEAATKNGIVTIPVNGR